jgi:hypothetical protein
MKKVAVALILALLFSAVVGAQFINFGKADPYPYQIDFYKKASPPNNEPRDITIFSPENKTIYTSDNISFSFKVTLNSTMPYIWSYIYITTVYYKASWLQDNITVYKWSNHDLLNPSDDDPYLTEYSQEVNLTKTPEGKHNITITAVAEGEYYEGNGIYYFALNVSSSVNFIIDTTPPSISVPMETRYNSSDVPLNFTINEPYSKLSYMLDNKENVTISGNTTLASLPNGMHNVTVYAWDVAGNIGTSGIMQFSVEVPKPFPTTLVAAASGASAVVVAAGLLVYFKKRKN